MQIPIMCLACLNDPEISRVVYALGDLDDEGRLSGQCEHGHTVRYRSPRPNHEWLTTAGAFALCDGYYREASASFAAALESSFAFYVEVSLLRAHVHLDQIRQLLKQNRQDQRRAGMISICYLRDTGKQFPYLKQTWVEFRNNVIHNGHWPSRQTALEYAGYVCGAIADLYQTLGPDLEPHYHQRLGEVGLSLQEGEVGSDDIVPFLDFFMEATSVEAALSEFRRRGPRQPILAPRLVK